MVRTFVTCITGLVLLCSVHSPLAAVAVNVARSSNGATATASSELSPTFPISAIINGDRRGFPWGAMGGWASQDTGIGVADHVEIAFNGSHSINRIDIITIQDDFNSPVDPQATQVFASFGVRDYSVRYWTGSAWALVGGGLISQNYQVWRTHLFETVTTNRIRIDIYGKSDGYSRLAEVEAWTAGDQPPTSLVNFAHGVNGGAAYGSSTYSSVFPASATTNGDRAGYGWGAGTGGWADGTTMWGDTLTVDFTGPKSIQEIDVFTVQDAFNTPGQPTTGMQFSLWGITHYRVQALVGTSYIDLGAVTDTRFIWHRFTFPPITTSSIRIQIEGGAQYSRITEVEAWGAPELLTSSLPCVKSAAATALTVAHEVSPISLPETAAATRLVVLFQTEGADIPEFADEISLAAVAPTPQGSSLRTRLGNPRSVVPAISHRIESRQRLGLRVDAPRRMLERFVVLDYSSAAEAAEAKSRLRSDPVALSVSTPIRVFFHASPNDPLHSYDPGVTPATNGQWASNALSLSSAWDYLPGSAYVAILDNGVQVTHPDLAANLRVHFSEAYCASGGTAANIDEFDLSGCGGGTATFGGHGTHVAGIVGAVGNNSTGTSGTCQNCSLMIGRIGFGAVFLDTQLADGLTAMVDRGAQVVSMSLGLGVDAQPNDPYYDGTWCTTHPLELLCIAISFADERQVSLVAASGNAKQNRSTFPASDSRVIAVGGVQVDGGLWDSSIALSHSARRVGVSSEIGTNTGGNTIVAPARDILSSFYSRGAGPVDWNAAIRCGSSPTFLSAQLTPNPSCGFDESPAYGFQYGICTGTSMAAPFASGVVALIRSANPLLSKAEVKNKLTQSASRYPTYASDWGWGVPNAGASVASALAPNNRLTPLFGFYNPTYEDFLYTTVPQMGSSAIVRGLLPQPPAGPSEYYTFSYTGNLVAGYGAFPGVFPVPKYPYAIANYAPRAKFLVFTTKTDAGGMPLIPVYRFSFVDMNGGSIVRHLMAFGEAEKSAIGPVWTLDGTEGYVYPPNISQPAGTAKIVRYVHPGKVIYVLFPDGEQGYWASQGFVPDGTSHVGYAFPN